MCFDYHNTFCSLLRLKKIKAICSSASLICYLKNVNLTVSRINEMIAFIIVYIQVHEVDFSVVQNIASWLLHSACLTVIWSYKAYISYLCIFTHKVTKIFCVFCLANGDAIKLYLSFADLFVMLLKNIVCTIYSSWAVAEPRFWFEPLRGAKMKRL